MGGLFISSMSTIFIWITHMYMDNVIIEGLFQTNNQESLPLSKEGSLKHYPVIHMISIQSCLRSLKDNHKNYAMQPKWKFFYAIKSSLLKRCNRGLHSISFSQSLSERFSREMKNINQWYFDFHSFNHKQSRNNYKCFHSFIIHDILQ